MKIPNSNKNSVYWDKRELAEQDWISKNLMNDEKFNNVLKEYYTNTIDDVTDMIDIELSKYANNEGINIDVAKSKVNELDIRRFEKLAKQVVKRADEYRRENGGKSPGESIYLKPVNDRMRLYNATMRINRIELIKAYLGIELVGLGLEINHSLYTKLESEYIEEIERQAYILINSIADSDLKSRKVVIKNIMQQVNGGNFSERIWKDIDGLKAQLEVSLQKSIVIGKNPKAVSHDLKRFLITDFTNASKLTERLVRTESARVQTKATLDSLKRYKYKYCKWHAEPGMCHICKEISAKNVGFGNGVYKISEVPTLPAHPNCRCALSAYWVE